MARYQSSCRTSLSLRYLTSDMDNLLEAVANNSFQQPEKEGLPASSPGQKGWINIDWMQLPSDRIPVVEPSSVDVVMVNDRMMYIKRDDYLRLAGSQLSGNKARKMLALNSFKPEEFPECVVSYGGPQSNAMVALAAVVRFMSDQAQERGSRTKRFIYYTKKLPRFLNNKPSGNLFRALSLGMELVEVSNAEYMNMFGGEWGGSQEAPVSLDPPVPGNSLWIPQGGASTMALAGGRQLAREICEFWSARGAGGPLLVLLPGGTCSTAMILHHALEELNDESIYPRVEVAVIPCVGDEAYARRQMMSLNAALGKKDVENIPFVLPPSPDAFENDSGYFSFGEPDVRILETYRYMEEEHDIPIDLLYNGPALTILFRHWETTFRTDPRYAEKSIMFVHSGGLEGVSSQLLRYKYKGLVDLKDIQLPGRNQ